MNPKPFSLLNHFTMPCAISYLLCRRARSAIVRCTRSRCSTMPRRAGTAPLLPHRTHVCDLYADYLTSPYFHWVLSCRDITVMRRWPTRLPLTTPEHIRTVM